MTVRGICAGLVLGLSLLVACGGKDDAAEPDAADPDPSTTRGEEATTTAPTTSAPTTPLRPLDVDACALLTEGQALAFAAAAAGEVGFDAIGAAQIQPVDIPTALGRGGPATDPMYHRDCSWLWLTGSDVPGNPPNDGVELSVYRIDEVLTQLAADLRSELCSNGSPSEVLPGIGDYAEVIGSAGGTVRVGDTCATISYDGPIGDGIPSGAIGTILGQVVAALAGR